MTEFQASCPACGAEVVFKSGTSAVVVCAYCNSVVARTDRALEDLGKVADVSESGSPLEVGLKGVLRGVAFELTGRAQLGHSAGGMWDEWYAAFADGRWGWLAEAQGRFYLTFRREVPDPRAVPPFDALELGQPVPGVPAKVPLVAAEKGEARMLAAEGEIPYRLVPGETYLYADLSGQGGAFGTLDYGETPPLVFVGREVTLDELGILAAAAAGRTRERAARQVTAAQLQCPQCAGPLELRAPDHAERVTCPNCGSLLDINHGQLRYLRTLEPKGSRPSIPLGAAAEFEGQPFTVVGFMVRSVEFEGVRYHWQEYLLYNPRVGFRWLVESDGHWSFVRTVPPGEVTPEDKRARYRGKSYKVFQDALARAEYVQGEFYWKVEVGELVRAVDYVSPPDMLSQEVSSGPVAGQKKFVQGGEVNWSHGTYVPVKEIERKFNVKLPAPRTVAPNQPYPHKKIYRYWLVLVFAAMLVGVVMMVTSSSTKIFERTFRLQPQPSPTPTPLPPSLTMAGNAAPAAPAPNPPAGVGAGGSFGGAVAVPTPPTNASDLPAYVEKMRAAINASTSEAAAPQGTQVIFTEPFTLRARQNVRVTGRANVDNNYLYVAGDLINEETGLVQQFELPMEEYHGVEDGESWSEGSPEQAAYLSALPAGSYTMRLEAQWEKWDRPEPPQMTVRVEQGIPRLSNLILTLVGLSALPLLVVWRHFRFERRRWADSAFNPYDAGGEDGHGE